MAATSAQTPSSPRYFDFAPDLEQIKRYNENRSEVRRLQMSAAIVSAVLVVSAAALLTFSGVALWAIVLAAALGMVAIMSAALVLIIPRKMGSVTEAYRTSELVPAVVSDVRPRGLTLLALVDRSIDRNLEQHPSLVVRPCETLPGHQLREGERVPCVAVVGNRGTHSKDNKYQFVSPMPLAWASSDARVLREAKDAIPEREWAVLRENMQRAAELEASASNIADL